MAKFVLSALRKQPSVGSAQQCDARHAEKRGAHASDTPVEARFDTPGRVAFDTPGRVAFDMPGCVPFNGAGAMMIMYLAAARTPSEREPSDGSAKHSKQTQLFTRVQLR